MDTIGTFTVQKLAPAFVSCSAVTSSQAVRHEKDLWFAIDTVTMDICTVWCSCIVGTRKCCNHVIATLYMYEYAVSNLFTHSEWSFMSCEWNKSTLQNTPKDELTTTFGVNYVRDVQQRQNSMMYTQT